jgi:hypothetical protein
MGSAVGSLSQSQTTTTGPLWFDVSKYGAVAGSATATLNTAWARILPLLQPGATVYIPDHPSGYYYTDPLVCPVSKVRFQGAGRLQSTLKAAPGHGKTALIVGMPVADDAGHPLDADHFVPLAGVMDAGYGASRNGVRFRSPSTGRVAVATYPRSPLAFGPGDSWGSASSSSLTIELAVQGYIGGVPSCMPHGAVLGLADYQTNAVASPFYLVFTHGMADNSTYSVSGAHVTAVAGNTATITPPTPGRNPVGQQMVLVSGAGAGQVRTVTAFNSSTNVVTLDSPWATAPAAGDQFDIGYLSLEVHYRTGDGPLNGSAGPPFDPTFGGTARVATFRLGAYTGLLRLTLQLNLAATSARNLATCWTSTTGTAPANFIQTADAGVDGVTAGQLAAGLPAKVFQENQASHFQVNNLGITVDSCNNPGYPTAIQPNAVPATGDWMIAGLSFSLGQVYAVGTPGSAQALNPAGPYPPATVSDTFRYHNASGSANVCCIDLTDGPTSDPYGGVLSHWWAGPANPVGMGSVRGCGLLLPTSPSTFPGYYEVSDLGFYSNAYWGEAVTIGRAMEVATRDLYIMGYYGGIGTVNTQSTYNHRLNNLAFQLVYGDAIYGYEAIFRGADLSILNPAPRCAFRLIGSDLYLRGYQLFGQQAGHYAIVSHQVPFGGHVDLEAGFYDGEGALYPDVAFLCIEQTELKAGHGCLRLHDMELGSLGRQAPAIKLRGMGATAASRVELVRVADLFLQYPCRAVVQVDDAYGFAGTIERVDYEAINYDQAPLIESLDAATGRSGVKARVDLPPGAAGPPRTGLWTAGAAEVRCPDAADGQFGRLAPVVSGRYGTATPPTWAGDEVVRISNPGPAGPTQAAAAYVMPEDNVSASPTQV